MALRKPYIELRKNQIIIRAFGLFNSNEYNWHKDLKNRLVIPVFKIGKWMFQMDNFLPRDIKFLYPFLIKKKKYHRLIKRNKYSFILFIIIEF